MQSLTSKKNIDIMYTKLYKRIQSLTLFNYKYPYNMHNTVHGKAVNSYNYRQ